MTDEAKTINRNSSNKTHRSAYQPLPITVPHVSLTFKIENGVVDVTSEMNLKLRSSDKKSDNPEDILKREGLLLNGSAFLSLESISIDSAIVKSFHVSKEDYNLRLSPALFQDASWENKNSWNLSIRVKIDPSSNLQLSGLYKSHGNYVTQCEAEGFRNMIYSFDRPDVMSTYRTKIVGPVDSAPILLSNGNLEESGQYSGLNGYHYAVWYDPHPKPTYLFALVAGAFEKVTDCYTSISGKKIDLHFYSEAKYIHKLDHAISSLKRAMQWDEEKYGREYDLNLFNVIAIDDFNAGAMENKSLNIFNASLVVAGKRTATDTDFERIEGVVAHEYFHNWTGNRVTCRDWFQLTLKEGLTVYRDQEFSSDMNSRDVVRLQNVAFLRARQFPEDSSAMRHAIRPDEYEAVDNFYTYTVYEKGAEVVRMYESLYGKEGFRKGMDLYFQRHDGAAVTCDDFLDAMADANEDDLSQFRRWYSTAGTPHVSLKSIYNIEKDVLIITASQEHPFINEPSSGPLVIPMKFSLLHPETGVHLKISNYFECEGHTDTLVESLCKEYTPESTEVTLRLTSSKQTFIFTGLSDGNAKLKSKPIASVFRGLSAPVRFDVLDASPNDNLFLLKYDSDGVNRFNAGQTISRWLVHELYQKAKEKLIKRNGPLSEYSISDNIFDAKALTELMLANDSYLMKYFEGFVVNGFKEVLHDSSADGKFKAMAISFPALAELTTEITECDPVLLHVVLEYLKTSLAGRLRDSLLEIIETDSSHVRVSAESPLEGSSNRAIVNKAYSLLALLQEDFIEKKLLNRMRAAQNMTDEVASLSSLNYSCSTREIAMKDFMEKWSSDMLTMHKWYLISASCNIPGNFDCIENIFRSEQFIKTNPNNIYTLIGGLKNSYVNFHSPDYKGYSFLVSKVIEIDKINSGVAARLMSAFTLAKSYTKGRQSAICGLMSLVSQTHGISKQVSEIANATIRSICRS